MNICYDCINFHNLEPFGPYRDIWYNHLCKANPLPIKINPVTGAAQSVSQNDLGRTVYSDRNFGFCRDVNKGECENFQSKTSVTPTTSEGKLR